MVEIKIDFDFDENFVEMFQRAGQHEYTLVNEGEISLSETREILEDVKETKKFQNFERLGFLKILDDDQLIGLSMPRVIDKREHKVWMLALDKTYYRMGMIFIDEPYRGKGYAKEAALDFLHMHENLLWTIDPQNQASKKVAEYIGLTHNATLYIRGKQWRHEPWSHDRTLEIWSN